MDTEEAIRAAERIGYPVLVRPSYVLGGRSMEIIYDTESLRRFMVRALEVSPGHPILIDKFLEDAIEVDVDAISDGKTTVVAGIMEHIEEAGIHSGDSACVLPTITFSPELLETIERQTKLIAEELHVVGLMNIQYAIKGGDLYVLEVNPAPRGPSPSSARRSESRWRSWRRRSCWENLAGARLHETHPTEAHLGQGGGLPLQPLSQRGHPARTRDEVDGRSNGDRPFLWPRLREIADGGRLQDAARERSS